MIAISGELRKIISGGNLQGFYKGSGQIKEAVMIALEAIAKAITTSEDKINELEKAEAKARKEIRQEIKTLSDALAGEKKATKGLEETVKNLEGRCDYLEEMLQEQLFCQQRLT